MGADQKIDAVLCGDIGGTHSRLAVFSRGSRRPEPSHYQTYENQDEKCLEDILERYIKRNDVDVNAACLAVAGPVENGRIKTTNLPWEISESGLKERFGFDHVRLINDLGAMAFSVPWLKNDEQVVINPGGPVREGNVAVIAPGTGLGMALLVSSRGNYQAIASEGGHTDFAPSNENEWGLWKFLNKRFGHVSNERLVSGPGLVNIYQWLYRKAPSGTPDYTDSKNKGTDPAETITRLALEQKDPVCVETLNRFVSIFGSVAGNQALMTLAGGGIYLGGGIPPKILAGLGRENGRFMQAFVSKGRFEPWMRNVPVRVIVHDNPALLGAAAAAFSDLAA